MLRGRNPKSGLVPAKFVDGSRAIIFTVAGEPPHGDREREDHGVSLDAGVMRPLAWLAIAERLDVALTKSPIVRKKNQGAVMKIVKESN